MRLAYRKVRNNEEIDVKAFLKDLDADKAFIDYDESRSQLKELLMYGMENDVMVVDSLYDISSVREEIVDVLQNLAMKNMYIESRKENLSTENDTGNVMNFILSLMGSLSGKEKMEYANNKEEKHEQADKEGLFEQLYLQYINGHLSPVAFRKKLNVTKEELERLIDEYENY